MIEYKEIPSGYDFSSTFDTWILAYCPDIGSWFATNERFFFYEYPMEFENEEAAIKYFKENPGVFLKIEEDIGTEYSYKKRHSVWLFNHGEIKVD